jgi:O-antigen/teichoic acid export membrane protein
MTRATRHRSNAAICVLVLVYAFYQFATGAADSGGLSAWLVGAEAVLGVIGAIWFWRRSLGAA